MRPADNSSRPQRNDDEYIDGRVLPPGVYPEGGGHWQRREGYRGSYRQRPRPEDGYRAGPRNGYPARGDDGYPARGDEGYPAARDGYPAGRDGYPAGRDGYPAGRDGYPAGRDGYPAGRDGYPAGRDGYPARGYDGYPAGRDGYPPGRDGHPPGRDGYPARGYDGYLSHRDDGYPPRREQGFAGRRGAYRAPAPDPRYRSMPDGRFAPHPAAPDPYYDGYRDRVADDRGVSHDRSAFNRPTSGPSAYDRSGQSPPRPGTSGPPSGSRQEQQAAASEPAPEKMAQLVPPQNEIAVRPEPEPVERSEDDALTSPLPVILPGATEVPRPAAVEATRGPFEPARPSQPPPRQASITGSVDPPPTEYQPTVPPPSRALPEAAATKLDQLKDLYFTAEAIGSDALGKHFDHVSQRQSELIKDFFERSVAGDKGAGHPQA